MKHITRLSTFLIVSTLIIFSLIGCNQEAMPGQHGSVTFHLTPSDRLASRTILPEASLGTPLGIHTYTIVGTGPNNQKLNVTTATNASSVKIDNLLVGNWEFIATAYNNDGKALARGTINVYIIQNTEPISFPLTEVVGNGNLSISFTWNTEQVNSGSTFNFTLIDESGNTVVAQPATTPPLTVSSTHSMSEGTGSATYTGLPAGFYQAVATISSDGVQIAGFSDSVRIINETTSSATVNLIIGKVIDDVTFTISDTTHEPIEGTITINPTTPTVGDSTTLTYSANLPDAVKESDLIYSWFIDGVKITSATTKTLTITALAGTTRYDVVVGIDGAQSLGSASTSIEITPVPSISSN